MKEINQIPDSKENRRMYYEIWQRYKAGEELEGEEKTTAELMAQHTDWYDFWESTDFDKEFDPETNEFNPFLHLVFDTIITNQINENSPKQARFTYNKLTARGYSHLDAIHRMAGIFLEEFFPVMKYGKVFNEEAYASKLKGLKD
ncbi:MAG: DUF1841 family protein [Ignavibacteria bacterium]|nr:DUF1841 family protein [Ignavibacteria bacterium]